MRFDAGDKGLQRAQLVGITAHRFFHHHMISCIQRSHRGGDVLIVLRADESAVCQFGTGEQFAPVRRRIFRRDPVVTAELGAAGGVRYRPVLAPEDAYRTVKDLAQMLAAPGRVLPGG